MTVDVRRVAAMVAECDDDGELAEVLAEVYAMLPPGHQAAFRAATGPKPGDPGTWDEGRQRREARERAEAAAADFARRAEDKAEQGRRAVEAITASPERTPEERAELQARLERLQGDEAGQP